MMLEELRDLTTLPEDMLELIKLSNGSHPERADKMSAMEVAAWLAGEPHTREPESVSQVIRNIMNEWNDNLGNFERNRLLRPLLPRLTGTGRGTQEAEASRLHLCLDWCIQEKMPILLEANGRTGEARELRTITPSDSWTPTDAEYASRTLQQAERDTVREVTAMRSTIDGAALQNGVRPKDMVRLVKRFYRRCGAIPVEPQAQLAVPGVNLPRDATPNLLVLIFLGSIPDTLRDDPDPGRETMLSRAGARLNRTTRELQESTCQLVLRIAGAGG